MNDQTTSVELQAPAAATRKAESKASTVTRLLTRTKGATVEEMMEATAWQPHSVRAFLSGLRKKGNALFKEQRKSGEQAYRMALTARDA